MAGLDRLILSVIGSQLRYLCAVISHAKLNTIIVCFFIFHLVYLLYLIVGVFNGYFVNKQIEKLKSVTF